MARNQSSTKPPKVDAAKPKDAAAKSKEAAAKSKEAADSMAPAADQTRTKTASLPEAVGGGKAATIAGLRITAKRPGFRRAGRAWSGVTTVPADHFSDEQIAALKAEPHLVVEDVEIDRPTVKVVED